MASIPQEPDPTAETRERDVRVDQKLAAAMKTRQEIRFAPLTLIFTGMGAAAAFFAAGVAFAKLFIN